MSIHLRFVRENDWISNLISYASQGIYSHVDYILPEITVVDSFTGAAIPLPLEALGSRSDKVGGKPSGVEIRPADYAKFAVSLTLGLNVTEDQYKKFTTWLFDQLHKPYDHRGIWGIALGRDWREDGSWYCSELIAAGLEEAGILPRLITPTNRINPDRLATVVSAIGGWIVEELPVDNKTILTKK